MIRLAPNLYRYQTSRGRRYAVRVTLHGRECKRKGFLTQAQAADYLTKWRAARVDAKFFPDRIPLPVLSDYAPVWLDHMRARKLKANTLRSYAMNLQQHVLPEFGATVLDRITRQEITAFMLRQHRTGYSGNSIRLMLAPLSAIFTYAMDEQLLQYNPAARPSRILPVRRRKGDIEIFQPKEKRRMLASCLELRPDQYPLLSTLFGAGLRIGEALALERTDFDVRRGRLRITKNYTNGVLEPIPKGNRKRQVSIESGLVETLMGALRQHKSPLLFPGRNGYLFLRSWRRWVWERLLKVCQLKHRGINATRHTYATEQLDKGKSLAWLQKQLGHSSIQVTVDTYGHVSQDTMA